MSIVVSKNVKYAYFSENETTCLALKGVNISVKKGEFVAILGHNGSGKSTFAKHINVLLPLQEGELFVVSLDASKEENMWDIRSKASMVFQNPDNQIVSTVVEEDVAFGPENLGVPQSELQDRVDTALKAVNMQGYNNHAPHMLSGGQKQRVAIAGVLAMQPDIIVFDEPTAMLDPKGRKEVLDTVHALNKEQGKTVIFITHYMEEAAECDRVFVMKEGKVIDEGTPNEVFSHEDILNEAGLIPPHATQIAQGLQNCGIKLEKCPITLEELTEEICRLK